jgi:predicted DCC family thiol-disulfide oxidoreductase YuxK
VSDDGIPLLVFDGDCGFCTSSAAWIARRWQGPGRTVPWQRLDREDLARAGLTTDQVAAAAWWIDERGRAWRGHLAVASALVAAGGMWGALGRLLFVPPIRWLAAVGYRLVTRYRYRLPGGTPACRVPAGWG